MASTAEPLKWGSREAASFIRVPSSTDDKYSHGVLGVITGSEEYPGAAVLGVEAASRTGIGLIRFRGTAEATRLVLERRPEVVTIAGRVDAFLIGSGIDPTALDAQRTAEIDDAVASGHPLVLDAGCLERVLQAAGPVVVTPHHKELARLLEPHGWDVTRIDRDPAGAASSAADLFGATVVLKGNMTHVCSPADAQGSRFHAVVEPATTWLATAGTGDVLAGILGALLATHAEAIASDPQILGPLAASAVVVHSLAGLRASHDGPLVALDVAESIRLVVGELL